MDDTPTPGLPEAEKAIREALALLPPEARGTWRKLDKLPYIHVTEDPAASPWGTPCVGRFDYMETADYIMACNPVAITALLSHLASKDAEIERLRADAERFRWLSRKVGAHGVIDGWAFSFPTHLSLPAPVLAIRDPEAALGHAIDAAIAAQAKGGEQ